MSTELLVGLIGVVATAITIGGSWFVARRYRQLGGGEAQTKLNSVYKELTAAFEDKNKLLSGRLETITLELAELKGAIGRISSERIELKQELLDVHGELGKARGVIVELTAEIAGLRAELKASRAETVVAEKKAEA